MGDILSDLPAVTNFTFAERAEYASKPRTPSSCGSKGTPSPGRLLGQRGNFCVPKLVCNPRTSPVMLTAVSISVKQAVFALSCLVLPI